MARDFTDITIIPSTYFVAVEGEGYFCDPFTVSDVQGSVRLVPADRILAIHFHGLHGHGHVEGFGALEGFTDRTQLRSYFKAWLAARAVAKRAREVDLKRKQQIEDAEIRSHQEAIAATKGNIADFTTELAAASADRRAQVQAMIDVSTRSLAMLTDTVEAVKKRRATDDEIAAAKAVADEAQQENK
jgi:hypothetical protein